MELTFTTITVALSGIVLFVSILILVLRISQKPGSYVHADDDLYQRLSEEIRFSVAPKFLQLSIAANDLVELAVEIWRLEQRVAKNVSLLDDNQKKGFENSLRKLRRYLEKYDIEITDYSGKPYNEGLNLEVLSVEKDPSVQQPIIKETIEPTVLCKGQVVKRAKVILLTRA